MSSYIQKELAKGRVAGPFPREIVPQAHIRRFGVIPKANKWRLILDLSHPKGKSVNDEIQKELCTLQYRKSGNFRC